MGFSTVVAFSIIVISFVMVTGIVVSVAVEKIREINDAYRTEKRDLLKDVETEYEIVNINATGNGLGYHTLEVVLRNTGSETLEVSGFTLLVDGKIYSFSSNRSTLYPITSALLTVNNVLGDTGTKHRLKIVSENGISKYASYTVG